MDGWDAVLVNKRIGGRSVGSVLRARVILTLWPWKTFSCSQHKKIPFMNEGLLNNYRPDVIKKIM